MDEAWYVECDLEDALAAVIARQVQALTGFRGSRCRVWGAGPSTGGLQGMTSRLPLQVARVLSKGRLAQSVLQSCFFAKGGPPSMAALPWAFHAVSLRSGYWALKGFEALHEPWLPRSNNTMIAGFSHSRCQHAVSAMLQGATCHATHVLPCCGYVQLALKLLSDRTPEMPNGQANLVHFKVCFTVAHLQRAYGPSAGSSQLLT